MGEFIPEYFKKPHDGIISLILVQETTPFILPCQPYQTSKNLNIPFNSSFLDNCNLGVWNPFGGNYPTRNTLFENASKIPQQNLFFNKFNSLSIQDFKNEPQFSKPMENHETIQTINNIPASTEKIHDNSLSGYNSSNQQSFNDQLSDSTISEKKDMSLIKMSRKIKKDKNKIIRSSEKLKNITKNFGKNCAAFAISKLALPFLLQFITEEENSQFQEYVVSNLSKLTNIANFRRMLLPGKEDNELTVKFKKAFQEVSIIFIRDYSYNWIFNSTRIHDVKGHILARSKMLRRVKDPKNFTNIH